MFLEGFSDKSRVWIYQANRLLSKEEQSDLRQVTRSFLSDWAAHGKSLYADISIQHDCFIVIVVDEDKAPATGCSIDKSVELIKSIDTKYDLDLFNRFNCAYKANNEVKVGNLQEDPSFLAGDVLVYDNLVDNLKDLRNNWLKPVSDSWHKQFA